jgi:hypothetical protein
MVEIPDVIEFVGTGQLIREFANEWSIAYEDDDQVKRKIVVEKMRNLPCIDLIACVSEINKDFASCGCEQCYQKALVAGKDVNDLVIKYVSDKRVVKFFKDMKTLYDSAQGRSA